MKSIALSAALLAVCVLAGSSPASAPPVGPLPKSPVTTIVTVSQELIALALPRGQSGLVWRGKSNSDVRVARPLTETEVGDITVLVYVAGRPGTTLVTYGLTNGETVKAYRGARFRIVVKPRS